MDGGARQAPKLIPRGSLPIRKLIPGTKSPNPFEEYQPTQTELNAAYKRILNTGENTKGVDDSRLKLPGKIDWWKTKLSTQSQIQKPPPYRGRSHATELLGTEDEDLYEYLLEMGLPNFAKQPLILTNFEDGVYADTPFIHNGARISQDSRLPADIVENLKQHADRPEKIDTVDSGIKATYSAKFRAKFFIDPDIQAAVDNPGREVPVAVIVQAQRHVFFVIMYGGKIYSVGVGGGPDGQVAINTPDWFDSGNRRIIDVCIFNKTHLDRLNEFLTFGNINPNGLRMCQRYRQGISGVTMFDCTQILTQFAFSYFSGHLTYSFNCAKFASLIFKGRINCTAIAGISDPDNCSSVVCRTDRVPTTPEGLLRSYIMMYRSEITDPARKSTLMRYLTVGTEENTSILPDLQTVYTFLRSFTRVPDPSGIVPGGRYTVGAAGWTGRGGRRTTRKPIKRSNRRKSNRR